MNMPLKDAPANDGQEQFGREAEQRTVNILFGSYADILFVLLPFAVIALFKSWQSGFQSVLMSYDLAVAAAVLGGLAVVKFILGLLADVRMLKHRERIVFLVSGTVFLILVPGLLFSVLVLLADPVPEWIMFIQPVLLILAISAYSGAVASTNVLQEQSRQPSEDSDNED